MLQIFPMVVLAELVALTSGQFSLPRDEMIPRGTYLVRAEAVTAESFKVVHVYAGDQNLKGKNFSGLIYPPGKFGIQRFPTPVKRGDVAIWWLKKKDGNEELMPLPLMLEYSVFFHPVLDDESMGGTSKAQAIAIAETVEAIWNAEDKKRMNVLDEFVRSGDDRKAVPALNLLSNSSDPKGIDYLHALTQDTSIPVLAQIQADYLLSVKRKGWLHSADQLKLVSRWMTGSLKSKEDVAWKDSGESRLVRDISYLAQLGHFSVIERLDLMIKGQANPEGSSKFRTEMIAQVKRREAWREQAYPDVRKQEKEAGFNYLVKRVREEKMPANGIAAAKLFALYAPLSREHEMALRKLQREISAEAIRKEIETILKQE